MSASNKARALHIFIEWVWMFHGCCCWRIKWNESIKNFIIQKCTREKTLGKKWLVGIVPFNVVKFVNECATKMLAGTLFSASWNWDFSFLFQFHQFDVANAKLQWSMRNLITLPTHHMNADHSPETLLFVAVLAVSCKTALQQPRKNAICICNCVILTVSSCAIGLCHFALVKAANKRRAKWKNVWGDPAQF